MVAGQQHQRQACTNNDAADMVEKIGRYAVAIERVARQQNHIGPMLVCRAQDRLQAGSGITVLQAPPVLMLDMQIGAVNYEKFAVGPKRFE
jgi:hypothetical protein